MHACNFASIASLRTDDRCVAFPSEDQHRGRRNRHGGCRCPAEYLNRQGDREPPHLIAAAGDYHHPCHDGHSDKAVDDRTLKQGLNGIDLREPNT